MKLRETRYRFFLRLNSKTLEQYYLKPYLRLQVMSSCGRRLSIPVSNFQKFFEHEGLNGYFEVSVSDQGKICQVCKLDD